MQVSNGFKLVVAVGVAGFAACGGGGGIEVTSISPERALVGGGETFVVTGSGFSSLKGSSLTWGDTEISFEVVSDTEIVGTVPPAQLVVTPVTFGTGKNAVTVDYRYTGLFAADGKGGRDGNLYLVDPRDASLITVGAMGLGVTGLAFAADGTLFGVQSSNYAVTRPASDLVTVDPVTGAATSIGPLTDSVDNMLNHSSMPDITFKDGVLYGWTEDSDDPAIIDTGTGVVTVVGDSVNGSAGSGLTTLNDGTVLAATDGCEGGELWSVNVDTAACTQVGTLTLTSGDPALLVEVNAMTVFRGQVYATLNDDDFDDEMPTIATPVSLGVIDTATGEVTPIGSLPDYVDALASDEPLEVPGQAALRHSLQGARTARGGGCERGTARNVEIVQNHLRVAALSSREIATTKSNVTFDHPRRQRTGMRLSSLVAGDATVYSCHGGSQRLSAAELASFALVPNQRGLLKLVNGQGQTMLRNVTQIVRE